MIKNLKGLSILLLIFMTSPVFAEDLRNSFYADVDKAFHNVKQLPSGVWNRHGVLVELIFTDSLDKNFFLKTSKVVQKLL